MIGYLRLPLSWIAHSDRVGIPLMRVAIAIVFLWIGALKFAPYEADSITPFVANSPSHPATAQPEATGAAMEEWLKPSDSGSRLGDLRECTGRNASERRANLEKDNAQADPIGLSGKADMAG